MRLVHKPRTIEQHTIAMPQCQLAGQDITGGFALCRNDTSRLAEQFVEQTAFAGIRHTCDSHRRQINHRFVADIARKQLLKLLFYLNKPFNCPITSYKFYIFAAKIQPCFD